MGLVTAVVVVLVLGMVVVVAGTEGLKGVWQEEESPIQLKASCALRTAKWWARSREAWDRYRDIAASCSGHARQRLRGGSPSREASSSPVQQEEEEEEAEEA